MINTFYSLGLLGSSAALATAFLLGIGFGAVLELAGFGSSRRLAGVFYFTDLTVVKVMFTAMITAMIGLAFFERNGILPPEAIRMIPTFYGAAALGGAVFGIGFVAGGWCPGTAAVGAASGKFDAWLYLAGALIGALLFDRNYQVGKALAGWGAAGSVTLDQAMGVPQSAVLWAIFLAGSFVLWMCELWNPRRKRWEFLRLRQSRGLWLLLLSLAILLVALPAAPPERAAIYKDVAAQLDHISAQELTDQLMTAPEMLLLIDVRPEAEFRAGHLPGARNLPPEKLRAALLAESKKRPIVLYSNGMTHPAQLRDQLTRDGFTHVRFLTGGLDGYLDEIARPKSLRLLPVTPAEEKRLNWFLQQQPLTHKSAR